jgi:hypothetical protein
MSAAPASAVPTDAPRLVSVFWIPPTSPLAGWTPPTQSRFRVAMPARRYPGLRAASARSRSQPSARVERGHHDHDASENARNPIWTTRRGDACRKNLGTPTAAASSVMDSGSSRTPVAIAENPSATDRNNGTAKKRPACRSYWKKNDVSPARRVRFGSIAGSSRAAWPRQTLSLPPHEDPKYDPATEHQPDRR